MLSEEGGDGSENESRAASGESTARSRCLGFVFLSYPHWLITLQDQGLPPRMPSSLMGPTWLTGNADAIGSPDEFHGVLIDSNQPDGVHEGQDAAIEATGPHLQRPGLGPGLHGLPSKTVRLEGPWYPLSGWDWLPLCKPRASCGPSPQGPY